MLTQLVNDGFVQLPKATTYDEFLNTIDKITSRSQVDEEYFMPDYHLHDVLVFLQNTNFHNYGPYTNGSIFLQDKASVTITFVLC